MSYLEQKSNSKTVKMKENRFYTFTEKLDLS